MIKRALFLFLFLTLAGCHLGPHYAPPEPIVSDSWSYCDETFSIDAPVCDWWNLFEDPLLTKYIDLAALNNPTLLKAEANIAKARSLVKSVASYLAPQLTLDVNGSRQKFSKNGPLFTVSQGGVNPGSFTPQIPTYQSVYNATLDLNWEIDLFGKRTRALEAQRFRFDSAVEMWEDSLISLRAEVARTYFQLRSDQASSILLEENISLLEEILKLSSQRKKAGLDNDLEIQSIEADLASLKSNLPLIHASILANIYSVSVLIGEFPEALLCELSQEKPLPDFPEAVLLGLRSDLLRSRPDIRMSERELAAAVSDIAVAVASFFPTFSLFGDNGFQSIKLSNLIAERSNTWLLGGELSLPIFQGGRLIANLEYSEAAACEAFQNYTQVVLNAFKEAETAIVRYANDLKALKSQQEAVSRDERRVELRKERVNRGLDAKRSLLDTQLILIQEKRSLLDSKTRSLIDLVFLYKALGGCNCCCE